MFSESQSRAKAGKFSTYDAVLYEAAIQPWELNVILDKSNKFQCNIKYVIMEGLALYRDQYGYDMRLQGMTPPHVLTIGVPISGLTDDSAFWGEAIDPNGIYPAFDKELDCRTSGGHDQFVILIDAECSKDLRLVEILNLVDSVAAPVRISKNSLKNIHDACYSLLECVDDPDLIGQARLVSVLRSNLVGAIRNAFCESATASRLARGRRENRAISAMYEVLRANDDVPMTVSQVCVQAGINERTLERAVRAKFDCTVQSLLRRRRMHEARRQLLRLDATVSSVTYVSHDLGFHDGGRFARDYRKMFGEYPSQTLQRKPALAPRIFFP